MYHIYCVRDEEISPDFRIHDTIMTRLLWVCSLLLMECMRGVTQTYFYTTMSGTLAIRFLDS